MKRNIYLLIVGLFAAQTAAHAEMIQGSIINVDPSNDMISVRQAAPSKGTPQQMEIKVKQDTKTKNIASLKELQVGQEVKVDAKENKQAGLFEAKSIEVTTAEAAPTSTPSDSTSTTPPAKSY